MHFTIMLYPLTAWTCEHEEPPLSAAAPGADPDRHWAGLTHHCGAEYTGTIRIHKVSTKLDKIRQEMHFEWYGKMANNVNLI